MNETQALFFSAESQFEFQVSSELLQAKGTKDSSGIGNLLGWGMAAIYIGGRLPQIFLNVSSTLKSSYTYWGGGAVLCKVDNFFSFARFCEIILVLMFFLLWGNFNFATSIC